MTFELESKLEEFLRAMLKSRLQGLPNFQILENKKVADIILCREAPNPAAFFLEVKLFTPKKHRIGVGIGSGEGFQPELLNKRPKFFEAYLRWVLCDGTLGERQFVFAANSTVVKYLTGGSIGQKHNNIRPSIFQSEPLLAAPALLDEIERWVQEN